MRWTTLPLIMVASQAVLVPRVDVPADGGELIDAISDAEKQVVVNRPVRFMVAPIEVSFE